MRTESKFASEGTWQFSRHRKAIAQRPPPPSWEAYPLLRNLNKNGAGNNSQGGSFTVKIFLNFQLTLKADAEFYYTGL